MVPAEEDAPGKGSCHRKGDASGRRRKLPAEEECFQQEEDTFSRGRLELLVELKEE